MASNAERPATRGGRPAGPPWFRALFERENGVLYRVLLRTCQPVTAEDVRQETWVRAWLHRDELEPLHEKQQRVWLLTTGRRLAIDYAKRAWVRHENPVPSDGPVMGIADLVGRLDRVDEALDAQRIAGPALARLSPEQREMLAYRFAADLKTKEIAQVLGITKTAASSRLSRAVQVFEAAFEAHPYAQGGGTR